MPDLRRCVLLMDNGSLEPASTRQLRRLADELEKRVGVKVEPVSLAHSTKVPAALLDGRPAELLDAALDRLVVSGIDEVVVAPLFVGPSHAIVRHVPAVVAQRAGLKAMIAEPLFVPGERRLAEIVVDHVREQIAPGQMARVAVVDHGSPAKAVTAVRDAVAEQVREALRGEVADVAACSMERRAGEEFAFNEPLLENLLMREGWNAGPLVIALLFIAPGKHAGPEGDVARIVQRARGGEWADVRFTRVMGAHPLLVEILAERVKSTLERRGPTGV